MTEVYIIAFLWGVIISIALAAFIVGRYIEVVCSHYNRNQFWTNVTERQLGLLQYTFWFLTAVDLCIILFTYRLFIEGVTL